MSKTLSAVTLTAPASPLTQNSGTTFTFTATPTFTGTGGVLAYDLKFLVNPGGGFVTIATSTGLTTGNTNPVTGLTTSSATSITVTCANVGTYTIEVQGAPTSGGSYTLTSATQTVTVPQAPLTNVEWVRPKPGKPANELLNQGIITLSSTFSDSVSESGSASDSTDATLIQQLPFSQYDWPPLKAGRPGYDLVNQGVLPASGNVFSDSVSEVASASDTVSVTWITADSITESASASDTLDGVVAAAIPAGQSVFSWTKPGRPGENLVNQGILPKTASVFNDSVTEPASAADSLDGSVSGAQPFNQYDWRKPKSGPQPTELIQQGILPGAVSNTFNVSLQEPAQAADSLDATLPDILRRPSVQDLVSSPRRFESFVHRSILPVTQTGTLTDALGAVDIGDATGVWPVTVSESASSSDSFTGGIVFAASVSETASATESVDATNTAVASVSESVSATDQVDFVGSLISSWADTLTASDSPDAVKVTSDSIAEAAGVADTVDGHFVTTVSLTDALFVGDSVSVTEVGTASVTESASATDLASATWSTSDSITDSLSATDTPSTGNIINVSVSESASAVDSVTVSAVLLGDILEAISASEIVTVGAVYPVSITETVLAGDLVALATAVATTAPKVIWAGQHVKAEPN